MCDLWKNTLEAPTPRGAIPAQMRFALERLPAANVLKLYNAGSFFDRAAIPPEDHEEIASLARGFERVVVECHPALVGDASLRFRDLLGGPQLRGRARARDRERGDPEKAEQGDDGRGLRERAAASSPRMRSRIRSFVLVGLPFLRKEEWAEATRASIDLSFRAGAEIVSLIPTRLGQRRRWKSCSGRVSSSLRRFEDLEMAMEDFLEGEEGSGRARRASSSRTSGMPTRSRRPLLRRRPHRAAALHEPPSKKSPSSFPRSSSRPPATSGLPVTSSLRRRDRRVRLRRLAPRARRATARPLRRPPRKGLASAFRDRRVHVAAREPPPRGARHALRPPPPPAAREVGPVAARVPGGRAAA